MREEAEIRVRSTLLSGPPRAESGLVTAVAVLLVLFTSLLCWRHSSWFELLAASPRQTLLEGEYWRLITTTGVHADLKHFLANVPFLGFFGFLLYGYLGFWVFPVLTLALGGLVHLGALLTYPPEIRLVGASGVVYLMAGFWLTLYLLVERTRSAGKRLLQVAGITLIVLVPTSLSPGVSYRTHALGFAAGVVAAAVYFRLRRDRIRSAEVIQIEGDPRPEREEPEEPGGWIN